MITTAAHRIVPSVVIVAVVLTAIGTGWLASARGAAKDVSPDDVRRQVDELGLTDAQQREIRPMVDEYLDKQKQARDAFLRQIKEKLTAAQYGKLSSAMNPGGEPHEKKPSTRPAENATADGTRVAVAFEGGYETDPQDRGRPVVLVAAGLGVPPEVFRKAFSNVRPAPAGQEPDPAQVRKNKSALMDALAPYGVTNDRLDTVSNYYRYRRDRDELWRNTPATAVAIVRDGVVTGFDVTHPGAGYSSPPTVSVTGFPNVKATVKLRFDTDLEKNGSIKEITIEGH